MAKRRYAFHPVGSDALTGLNAQHPRAGTHVVFSDQGPSVGLPAKQRRGSKIRFIEDAGTGQFHGPVWRSSLIPVTKRNPTGDPYPADSARASALINDRRNAS